MKKLLSALLCAACFVFVGCNDKDDNVPAASESIEGSSSSSSKSSTTEALRGAFSVSATKQVKFSKGNLQCQPSTKTWRFAQNQYDVIGKLNSNATMDYTGWLDLFGWSTAATYYGISKSYNNADYAGAFVDWGEAVGEGWFTLSSYEWAYLISGRTDAKTKYGISSINGVNGLVLLPDEWTLPEGLTFNSGVIDDEDYSKMNKYSLTGWYAMERAGAVFLPAAGYGERDDNDVEEINTSGGYWSSTSGEEEMANLLQAEAKDVGVYHYDRFCGFSVRLVMDAAQINSK